jgi:hypothetical protein
MTEIATRSRAGLTARITRWVRSYQRELSARAHAAADERARRYGWEVMESTGRFGFGTRTYRDPRFDDRRRRRSRGAAQPAARDRSEADCESEARR